MKTTNILNAATKTLSGIELGGKKNDKDLAALDRGILEVALSNDI